MPGSAKESQKRAKPRQQGRQCKTGKGVPGMGNRWQHGAEEVTWKGKGAPYRAGERDQAPESAKYKMAYIPLGITRQCPGRVSHVASRSDDFFETIQIPGVQE